MIPVRVICCGVETDVPYQGRITWHLGMYRQISNIRGTLVGNKIAYHSDVVGAAPVQLHLYSRHNIWLQGIGQGQPQDGTRNVYVLGFDALILEI